MLFELSKETFENKVLQNETIVLIDFWAPWCRPCYALEPILETILEDYYGKISVYKLNVETYEEMADIYHIINLPTLGLFKDGKLVKKLAGLHSEKSIKTWLDL